MHTGRQAEQEAERPAEQSGICGAVVVANGSQERDGRSASPMPRVCGGSTNKIQQRSGGNDDAVEIATITTSKNKSPLSSK
jgi:hypothetical protein